MTISLIAALAKNRVIGKDNKLPWNLPADLKHFRDLTSGKSMIMGQKTFESIGRALPGRANIVLTRDKSFKPKGCVVAYSIDEALKAAGDVEEVMVIGGGNVFSQFLPLAHKMYLTLIDHDFEGDAYFPEFDRADWQETKRVENLPHGENRYRYTFVTLERKR
ncbi:MAG: dihydrofolate reductase [Parcubacteria group bacterium Gr01-1014_30]|nr:MAG: dihydrofolate reductase [Parcubacteria group bacterium Gr01-1014_30]